MKEQIVLMYHDILNSTCPKSGFQKVGALQYVIDASVFEEQLEFAKDMENVQFSFDDGGCSFYDVIAVMLERYNKRGIFFISTEYIGKDYFLTREQIKELDQRGHIIASHSHSHPTKISNLSHDKCFEEWKKSKEVLEDILGHEMSVASVPGGAVSDMVFDCMLEAGYKTIYTSSPNTSIDQRGEAKIYGRYGIKNSTSIEVFKSILTNPATRRKMLRHHKLLKWSKSILGSHYNDLKQVVLKLKRLS